mgnify:CR=1 FL=1
MGLTAQPLTVIDRRRTAPVPEIARLAQEHDVERIVVGRPLQLDGEAGLAVESAEAFVQQMQNALQTPIVWWDERLSTAQAERTMIAGGARRRTRRQNIDKVAAALILQSYLDAQGSGP